MALNLMKTNEREKLKIAPRVAIHESDREVVLEAEMVGLDKDDIKLELKGDELTISGERKEDFITKGCTPVLRERWPYEYSRTFVLGSEVDKEKIVARYENGVLTLSIPKSEEAQPKKIEIK